MTRKPKLLLIGAFLAITSRDAGAWSSVASKTYQQIKMLEMSIATFQSEHGRLPDPGEFHSGLEDEWRQQEGPPLDSWRRQFIYRVPGEHGDFDLHSTGENGIDDKGANDDISGWLGVNDGYYWMKWWPLGRFTLIASILSGILILAFKTARLRPMAVPLAGMVMGLGIGLGCFLLLHPGVVPERNLPLSITSFAGFVIFLISVVKLRTVTACLRYLRRRSTRKPSVAK
jgi:hypothetical protein